MLGLCGGMPTEVRLHEEEKLPSPTCRWCELGLGNEEHHIWHCPAAGLKALELRAEAAKVEKEILEKGGAPNDAARNTRGLYPQSRYEWSAEECGAASEAMGSPVAVRPRQGKLKGPIATDGGVATSSRPLTALGAWAWFCPSTQEQAHGYVARRPGQTMSTGRAEIAAIAMAAPPRGTRRHVVD